MPNPALAVAGAQAAGEMLSQGINAITTGIQNKKSRKWSEKMYGIQRADALADYHMQNAYNHPSAVMERYKEAKLNPNLIYGTGTSEGAASMRSSSVEKPQFEAPRFDIGGALGGAALTYIDQKMKSAQVDNLREQNTLLSIEQARKLVDLEHSSLNLGMDKETRETTVELRKENLEALKADILNKNIAGDNLSFEGQANKQRLINEGKLLMESIANSQQSRKVSAAQISNIVADTISKYTTNQKLNAEIASIIQSTINAKKTGQGIDYDNVVKSLDAKMAELGLSSKTATVLKMILDKL